MVSLFGESNYDRRDVTIGLAGFMAGVHSLRILAERGIASPEDIQVSLTGIRQVMAQLPEGMIDAAKLAELDRTMDAIYVAALEAAKAGGKA